MLPRTEIEKKLLAAMTPRYGVYWSELPASREGLVWALLLLDDTLRQVLKNRKATEDGND